MNIIVFGSSQVHGLSDWKNGGWVQLVKSYAEKNSNFDDIVYNLGIIGDTSTGILRRFEAELKPRLEIGGRNIVIISVGINDSQYFHGNRKKVRTPEYRYKKNIEKIIKTARKYTKNIFFVGIIPVDDKKVQPIPWAKDKSYAYDMCKKYNEAAREVCKRERVPFLDLFSILSKINYKKLLGDGVHPTSEGHKIIFKHVLKFLTKNGVLK